MKVIGVDMALEIFYYVVSDDVVFFVEVDGEGQLLDFSVRVFKVFDQLIVLMLEF